MTNPIWLMTSAYDDLNLEQVIRESKKVGVQGIDLCVFRKDSLRTDHVATHLDYDNFNLDEANKLIDIFNENELRLSIGAYDNLIGGPTEARIKNQNHLLKLIRIAHLLGGDENDVKVGTFVGYNHELGNQEYGFQKNLEAYAKVFEPIIRYAEQLGVTILYENCPMEGWRSEGMFHTFNNLTGVLAARKLMYEIIPSKAHGEIYDPSHDIWQHNNPIEVIEHTDVERLHRIHVKATRMKRNKASILWGGVYPMQAIDKNLAESAGVPTCQHEWDRHHYETMMPGFGGSDDLDWNTFLETLYKKGFEGALVMENEAEKSKATGNLALTNLGFETSINFLAPILWPLSKEGYIYPKDELKPLRHVCKKDIPSVKMSQLL
ncbi:MAG: sugar phosphate isomerase/epimerase [Bacteroidota bacterium]